MPSSKYSPDLPLLDMEQVNVLIESGGDEAAFLMTDLRETYIAEAEPRIRKIAALCGALAAPEVLREHMHFIAGSSANLGLLRLSTYCRWVLKQIDHGEFAHWAELPGRLSEENRVALEAFSGIIPAR